MFTKTQTPIGETPLGSPVAEAGGILEFYSFIMDSTIQFEAFITGYSDSFNSNWQGENVYGRMDPIYTFQNTQRTMSLAFTIPNVIHPKEDSDIIGTTMDSVNKFFQFLYPKYEQTGNALTISQAPLVRIKFANMIANSVQSSFGDAKTNGLLATITSLGMNPKIEHGFSRVERNGNTLIYPNFIDLSLAINVVHEKGRFGSGANAASDFELAQELSDLEALEPNFADQATQNFQNQRAFPYGNFAEPLPELTIGATVEDRTYSVQTEGEGSGQIVFVAGSSGSPSTADGEPEIVDSSDAGTGAVDTDEDL